MLPAGHALDGLHVEQILAKKSSTSCGTSADSAAVCLVPYLHTHQSAVKSTAWQPWFARDSNKLQYCS
jgi:hypothetical protein